MPGTLVFVPRPYRVLFLCAANSHQSQMAEGWLRRLGGDRFLVRSAGVEPRHLHPLATRVMQEAGVDISAQRGKGVDAVRRESFDLCVALTEAARAGCPELPHVTASVTLEFDDPTWIDDGGDDIEEFRRLRDELRAYVEELVARVAAD
jgi:arsenate reductase